MQDCGEEKLNVKLEHEDAFDPENGDSSLISKTMILEEEKLLEKRVKEEDDTNELEAPQLNDTQFNKLDELLTQTQLYSEFLLEKMDDISKVCNLFL